MKNKTKYLVVILLMLVSFLLIGATSVNAETTTADVDNNSDLVDKMNDKTTDIVRLTSDITLETDYDTKIFIEMSKTLDFNGFTLTIPENQRLQLIYKNSLDLKFINSSSSKTAKLKILTHGTNPIYNEIMNSEYTVNFEIDGVDVEYEKDYETFWTYAGDNGFNNLVFKNLKITGFHTLTYNGDGKTIKFSNVTKESNNSPIQQFLINSSTLTVDDIIDANSVIEYYPSGGVKVTADRTATLDTINGYWGPITVKFANGFNVSDATLTGEYGETPETNIAI